MYDMLYIMIYRLSVRDWDIYMIARNMFPSFSQYASSRRAGETLEGPCAMCGAGLLFLASMAGHLLNGSEPVKVPMSKTLIHPNLYMIYLSRTGCRTMLNYRGLASLPSILHYMKETVWYTLEDQCRSVTSHRTADVGVQIWIYWTLLTHERLFRVLNHSVIPGQIWFKNV